MPDVAGRTHFGDRARHFDGGIPPASRRYYAGAAVRSYPRDYPAHGPLGQYLPVIARGLAVRRRRRDTQTADDIAIPRAGCPDVAIRKIGAPTSNKCSTVFVRADGLLRFGPVASDNPYDKTRTRQIMEELVAPCSPQELQNLIDIANSSFVTGPNLVGLRDLNLPIKNAQENDGHRPCEVFFEHNARAFPF